MSNVFPLSLMLTMTINRSQGQTLLKEIIALPHNPNFPLTYAHFYVALSRVRRGDHIRLLIAGNSPLSQIQNVAYIDRLKPDPSIHAWISERSFRRQCKLDGKLF